MEQETDQTRFFEQYSSTSVLLDERFVDLVLLSDSVEGNLQIQKPYQLDMLSVIEEVEWSVTGKGC